MSETRAIDGGVTAPRGFRASGLACGIKASGKPDLALIATTTPASAAGVFTTNLAKAAPVLATEAQLATSNGVAHAVITNSGCANACTGPQGMDDAREMIALTASSLGCAPELILVASTGVIGVNLKMDAIRRGIPAAVSQLSATGGASAARAIMTTDPFPKEAAVEVQTSAGTFRVGGMAKGSGMIEPRMATMLGYLTTDAQVDPSMLKRALVEATRYTFNAITVDGEPSTNDCVFALANGASGMTIDEGHYPAFVDGLRAVAKDLALAIVRGGEGATKLVAITASGAKSDADAWLAARAIANSLLVKTAIHGGDPNWGRLVAAAGRSGAAFTLEGARVRIGSLVLFERGRPFDELAPQAAEYLTGNTLEIEVGLGAGGSHSATVWTCDLSAEYVKINAEYPDLVQNFLSILDFNPDSLSRCLDLAATLKRDRVHGRLAPTSRALNGRHVGLLFEKPSLRTRVTFTIGVRELGGDIVEIPADVMHADREPIHDVARNLERWVDAVVIRTFSQERLVHIAEVTPRLHVINALSNEEHPCQALADMQTLVEQWGSLEGKRIAFVGDGNNVCASLVHACMLLGIGVQVATPKGYELPDEVVEEAAAVSQKGAGLTEFTDPRSAVRDVDAIYTDVWTSMGQEVEYADRKKTFRRYQVTEALMALAKPTALFMHCLPAHRGEEVSDEVIESKASVVFDQAENRLHAQKALLVQMLADAPS